MFYEIISLQAKPEMLNKMADWFSASWNLPRSVYRRSMQECLQGKTVPQWYVAVADGRIIGGLGVIENDFHNRKDLSPNVCAVYVEKSHRGKGVAGGLLKNVCRDMAQKGVTTLYLVTDHTNFYERYGWQFLCPVQSDGEENLSRMYIHKTGESL